MLENAHRWAIELLDPSGGAPESFPLSDDRIDWDPALESTRWGAVRSGGYSPQEAWAAPAAVRPIESGRLGEPYASGFEVALASNGARRVTRVFSMLYFKGVAEECAASWVQSGRLTQGDRFRYLLTAFRQDDRFVPIARTNVSIRTLPPAITIEEQGAFEVLGSEMVSLGEYDPSDPPVFVPRSILNETIEHVLSSPDRETGGFLLGSFHRRDARDVVTAVTGYVPSRAEGTATRLSFTPECWTAARSAIALRGNGEALVAWVHSHIVDELCRNCGEEKRRVCPLASGFFSEHDRALHRVAFPRAYQFALVVNVSAGKATHSCFGWRDGAIVMRGVHIDREREEALTCPERE